MRWFLILSGYRYQIRYWKAEDHGNVDVLSRLPLPSTESNDQECPMKEVLFMDQWPQLPCTANDLKQATRQNPLLAKVMLALQSGRWPKPLTEELVPFQRRVEELAVVKNLVM